MKKSSKNVNIIDLVEKRKKEIMEICPGEKTEIKTKELDLQKLTGQITKTETDLQKLTGQITKTETDLRKLKEKHEESIDVDALIEINASIEKKEKELARNNGIKNQLLKKKENLNEKVEALQSEIKNLKEKIEASQLELEAILKLKTLDYYGNTLMKKDKEISSCHNDWELYKTSNNLKLENVLASFILAIAYSSEHTFISGTNIPTKHEIYNSEIDMDTVATMIIDKKLYVAFNYKLRKYDSSRDFSIGRLGFNIELCGKIVKELEKLILVCKLEDNINEIYFIGPSTEPKDKEQNSETHAEMQLLSHLLDNKSLNCRPYIGVSKPCCISCTAMLEKQKFPYPNFSGINLNPKNWIAPNKFKTKVIHFQLLKRPLSQSSDYSPIQLLKRPLSQSSDCLPMPFKKEKRLSMSVDGLSTAFNFSNRPCSMALVSSKNGLYRPSTSPMKPSNLAIEIIKLKPDGDCFYNAVLLHLSPNEGYTVLKLRDLAADYIQQQLQGSNQELFKSGIEQQISEIPNENRDGITTVCDYVKKISKEGRLWAGNAEIVALMRVLGRPIHILDPNNNLIHRIRDEEINYNQPIYVRYNGRDHYDGVTLKHKGVRHI